MDNFHLATYQIVLEAGPEGLWLPRYKGSTLRGGFGRAFKRIACAQREIPCPECLLRTTCPYAYVFETAPPPGAQALRNYENIPRPFVLEPPDDGKERYRPGETLTFGLVLVGRAVNYLPYFIVAFRELGAMGIGKGRHSYRLTEIRAVHPLNGTTVAVYREEDHLVRNVNLTVTWPEVKSCAVMGGYRHAVWLPDRPSGDDTSPRPAASDQLTFKVALDFLTMTRIKYDERYAGRLEFHMLVRALLRRISSLAYFHHGFEPGLDYQGLIEKAGRIKIVADDTRWVDWERYSSRQDGRVKMGGLVGRVVYEGDLEVFFPLLLLGELIHVGKGAVFGMGKYEVVRATQ